MLGSRWTTGVPTSVETKEGHINMGRNYVLETGRNTGPAEKHRGMIYVSCLLVE